jgi:tetratricopeptide (TPR) repeat protein
MGIVKLDRANPGEAVVYLRRAVAGMPRSVDARIRLAEALAADGDVVAALSVLDEAAAIDPASSPAYLMRGRLYESLGQMDEAIEAYQTAIQLDASQGVARARLGSLERARARASERGGDGPTN